MTDRAARPTFDTDPVAAADAHAAVVSLVAELQAGIDRSDANATTAISPPT
jgi:hypothetical protein